MLLKFILLKTDNARSDGAVRRRVEILRFPLLFQCVFRLETFDDLDNTAPTHKFGKKLMSRRSVIEIVERFQAKHALEEQRETKNLHPSTNGAVAPGIIRF